MTSPLQSTAHPRPATQVADPRTLQLQETTMSLSPVSTFPTLAWLTAVALSSALLAGPAGSARAQTPAPDAPAATATSAMVPAGIASPARDMPLIKPPASETVDNPYGLRALWGQGDIVARLTLLILLIMSVASWYVLVKKLIEQHRLRLQAGVAQKAFSGMDNLRKSADALGAQSPFRFIVVPADRPARRILRLRALRLQGALQAGARLGSIDIALPVRVLAALPKLGHRSQFRSGRTGVTMVGFIIFEFIFGIQPPVVLHIFADIFLAAFRDIAVYLSIF